MSAKFSFDEDEIRDLLKMLYEGDLSEVELPENLYFAIAKYLKQGLYNGFGGTLEDFESGPDLELLEELRDNVYLFSAAKTYQQIREMVDAIYGKDDRIKPFDEFKEDATEIFQRYNIEPDGNGYLRTEYNTCVAQATNAKMWERFERQKDDLPMLEYSTIGDACDICGPLDGLVAPVDDAVWRTIMPENHFNCRCVVMQRDESFKATEDREAMVAEVSEHMDDEFKMNPGLDGYIFKEGPDGHPYFQVAEKDKAFAANNFGLPIPDKDDEDE